MVLYHGAKEESSPRPPAPPPDWELEFLDDLRRIAPEFDSLQRRVTLAALKLWSDYCRPATRPDFLANGDPPVWLPSWWIEAAPFELSAEETRACLRFFESLWGLRQLQFGELVSALSYLRRPPARPFGAGGMWRAAARAQRLQRTAESSTG